jgi:hypothetical protein
MLKYIKFLFLSIQIVISYPVMKCHVTVVSGITQIGISSCYMCDVIHKNIK